MRNIIPSLKAFKLFGKFKKSSYLCIEIKHYKLMTLKQLKQELVNKPSYFKESAFTISKRFKCPVSLVKTALNELREERKEYNKRKNQVLESNKLDKAVEVYRDLKQTKLINELRNLAKQSAGQFTPSQLVDLLTGDGEQTLNSLLVKNLKEEPVNIPKPFLTGDPKNTLIIGDTHLPFEKPGYLEFCREVQEKYNCGTVVHIGDLVDNHAVSYHEKDSEGKSAGDEYRLALEKCHNWYKVFPNVKICIGNHDALPFRKAFTAGLPSAWLKSYQEILESPKTWEWDFVHNVNDVIYQHGTGMSGEMAAINAARENRQSTVIGHLHTVSNIKYMASYKDLIFGMTVGCGIDFEAYAFAYGRQQTRKPVIACGVVQEGRLPIIIPMSI